MSKKLLVYHHLGLGDHFMCHGFVREYAKLYDEVVLFSHTHNLPTVAFMYRDLPNLTVLPANDAMAQKIIREDLRSTSDKKYDEVRKIGFENLDRTSGVPLELQFYKMAGVDFAKKWTNFHVDRDLSREKSLFQRLKLPEHYAFVHQDRPRGYRIRYNKIESHMTRFEPKKELAENMFDYCTIIENATEIHVIDSSFMFLIDCLPYDSSRQKLFIHRYARENSEWQLPILKKRWHVINEDPGMLDPLKRSLEKLSTSKVAKVGHSLLQRMIRKIFRNLGWTMGGAGKLDVSAHIERQIPTRSFLYVKNGNKDDALNLARAKDRCAKKITVSDKYDFEKEESAEIVFYSLLSEEMRGEMLPTLLSKLHTATKQTLILHSRSPMNVNAHIEKSLKNAHFEILERNVTAQESLFTAVPEYAGAVLTETHRSSMVR